MWRTYSYVYCTNCGQDGHTSERCAGLHVHQWRLAHLGETTYRCSCGATTQDATQEH